MAATSGGWLTSKAACNGASIDTLFNMRIEVYGRNLNGCIYAVNATELEICNCDIDETVFDPSASYFVEAAGCPTCGSSTIRWPMSTSSCVLSGCTNYRVVGNRSLDQINTTMLFDAGGNSGTWVDNREVGFLGFYTPNAYFDPDCRWPSAWALRPARRQRDHAGANPAKGHRAVLLASRAPPFSPGFSTTR